MTRNAKLMTGILLLIIPTIQYGGYFLLTILSGRQAALQLTDFQKSMFRAGQAHAGVLTVLAIICQMVADHAPLPTVLEWGVRVGFLLSALLISGGFFFSATGNQMTSPNGFIVLASSEARSRWPSLSLVSLGRTGNATDFVNCLSVN
jgi:hypothetical protein